MPKTLFLAKANNDGICFCECEECLIAWPGQLDCPWCGCGWLFTCMTCRKAFTFARVVEVDQTLEELARVEHANSGLAGPPEAQWLESAAEFMHQMLTNVEEDATYVYFDGYIIPTYYDQFLQEEGEDPLEISGMHRDHALERVPQVQMLDDPSIAEEGGWLVDPAYWGLPRESD